MIYQVTAFTVEELVELTISFYRRNYIEGSLSQFRGNG
jgi:predicted DNA-binding helix-hairpin-helix protein